MRKINFRVLFYGLVSFCLALVFTRHILNCIYIVFALVCFSAIFYLCFKYKQIKRFVFIILMFCCGVGYFFCSYANFVQPKIEQNVVVLGRASSVVNKTGYSLIVLDDIKINNKSKSFNIIATVSNVKINLGDKVFCELKLNNVNIFKDNSFNSFCYKNNAPYKISLNNSNCVTDSGYKKFNEKLKYQFNTYLNSHFQKDIASIISSVIIGDKTTLDTEIKEAFAVSGIGHLLAISGLHVGVIVIILNYILDKCKLNRKIKFVIFFVILSFYCYICGYSPSVTRASLMCLIFLLAQLCAQKYDRLNCLSLCAFLILFVKPFYIFDAGFLLSFVSVFCIFTIYPLFKKLFNKIKNKKLNNALSLILSVQIGLLPIMSIYYKSFNLLSLVSNLICVPLFEFTFILTFCLLPICMLLPFLTFCFKFLEFLYFVLIQIAYVVSCASFLTISLIKVNGLFCIGAYSDCFVCSNYVNLNKKQKLVLCLSFLTFSILCSIFI